MPRRSHPEEPDIELGLVAGGLVKPRVMFLDIFKPQKPNEEQVVALVIMQLFFDVVLHAPSKRLFVDFLMTFVQGNGRNIHFPKF